MTKTTTDQSSDSEFERISLTASFFNRKTYCCSFPGCRLTFQRRDHFDRHEFTHNGLKKHTCTVSADCARTYTNASHLKRHIRTAHTVRPVQSKTIACAELTCSKKFTNASNAKRHYSQQHEQNRPEHLCRLCEMKFPRKAALRTHMFEHTGDYPYRCRHCSLGFLNRRHCRRHELDDHRTAAEASTSKKEYRCTECQLDFDKWSLLVRHRRTAHRPACDICHRSFLSKANLKVHVAIHTETRQIFECTVENCPKFYFKLSNLRTHSKVTHEGERFECDLCAAKLTTKQRMRLHLDWHIRVGAGVGVEGRGTVRRRRRRKDAGLKKESAASLLTGITGGKEAERLIMAGRGDEISLVNS